jgi:asparagine synthase (glutamine-hydrolysing)
MILGWIQPSAGSDPQRTFDAMLSGSAPPRGLTEVVEEMRGFRGWGTEAARNARAVLLLCGRPRWSNGNAGQRITAGELLTEFERAGVATLPRLAGDFSLVYCDFQSGRCVLAVDRMGIRPLSFASLPSGLVFASSTLAVARHAAMQARVDAQALYDFLFYHMVPSPATIFHGVQKLAPAHYVEFDGGTLRSTCYWNPQFSDRAGSSPDHLAGELRATLDRAVSRCSPDESTGAFLSGGLDSSTVAGVFSRLPGSTRKSFSIGFDVPQYDELTFARIAARHFNLDAHEYQVTPADIVQSLESIASAYDEPFANSSAVPTLFCARLAANHGMKRLLAGDGGDEIFAGNERYARQHLFEAYGRLPRGMRTGVIEPLLRSPLGRIPYLGGKLRSYIEQALIPLPRRLETWNFLYRVPPASVLEPQFLSAIDTEHPYRIAEETYQAARTRSLVDRMMYFDWKFTLADNDLRKVNVMCALAGVEVDYPMLDSEVVEFSTRVPGDLKLKGGRLRYFYKRAMEGFLPGEIISKEKHGFGLPFGNWLQHSAELQQLVYPALAALGARRIVRQGFVDELIRSQQTGHASFFGYMVWVLLSLELWLRRNRLNP